MKIFFALILSAIVATAAQVVPAKVTPETLFHAGEWQIDAGYNGRFSGWKTVQDGAAFGVNYLPWLNLGFGAEAQIIEFGHTELDRVGMSLIGRLPIEKLRLAPEARIGFLYDLESGGEYGETANNKRGRGFDAFIGAGAEFRFTKNLGLGAEVRGVADTEDFGKNHIAGILRLRASF